MDAPSDSSLSSDASSSDEFDSEDEEKFAGEFLFLVAAGVQQLVSAKPKRKKRKPNVNRNHTEGHDRIFKDYFSEEPVFDADTFRRRFALPLPDSVLFYVYVCQVSNEPRFICSNLGSRRSS
jgi:hypothetical protein